jgi:alpha-ribazole phosphatase
MRHALNLFDFMQITVIRHTQVNIDKDICYGQYDVSLADTFFEEVMELKNKLSTTFDAVYCSPLSRCKNLSQALGYKNTIYDAALLEMNFGDWESIKWNDINQEDLNVWMTDFVNTKAPNGENLLELSARVQLFMNNLREKDLKNVLIITHAGVIRCIWGYLLDIPLSNIVKIPVGHNEVFVFDLGAQKSHDAIKHKK